MPSPKDLIGKTAPTITLPDATGSSYTLDPSSATGPIVLFFYPEANSFGCTREACSFRDALATKPLYSSSSSGVQIIGISPDPVAKQKAFVDQHKLTYPILSDTEGTATKAYQVGRGMLGLTPGRTTFIIDKGNVQDVYDSVINYGAHQKFVTKWLEKYSKSKGSGEAAATTGPSASEEIEAETAEPEKAAEWSAAPADAEVPPTVAAVDAEVEK